MEGTKKIKTHFGEIEVYVYDSKEGIELMTHNSLLSAFTGLKDFIALNSKVIESKLPGYLMAEAEAVIGSKKVIRQSSFNTKKELSEVEQTDPVAIVCNRAEDRVIKAALGLASKYTNAEIVDSSSTMDANQNMSDNSEEIPFDTTPKENQQSAAQHSATSPNTQQPDVFPNDAYDVHVPDSQPKQQNKPVQQTLPPNTAQPSRQYANNNMNQAKKTTSQASSDAEELSYVLPANVPNFGGKTLGEVISSDKGKNWLVNFILRKAVLVPYLEEVKQKYLSLPENIRKSVES